MHPTARTLLRQQHLEHHTRHGDAVSFFNALTGPEFLDQVESLLPAHRERLYPPTETLSMFMAQALNADRSCQKAVNEAAARRVALGLSVCSVHTGAYCRARERLPVEMVRELSRYSARWVSTHGQSCWYWKGRRVRLADGTTVTLPDTPANQHRFPQSRSQKPGLGFPLCRMVGIVCLSSGAVLDAAISAFRGEGNDERTLLRSMLEVLERGDILLGDGYFPTYFLLCTLRERGIDVLCEQHGARKRVTDFRTGRRLGVRDHLIEFTKPVQKPDWMSQADYDRAPKSLTVRELRAGGKILVTSLLDARQFTKSEIKQLYVSRWHIELDLRNIKTTMGMERLSCLSPEMAIKEIWVYLLAYNLIRLVMAQAAKHSQRQPRELSFKHTVQIYLAWSAYSPYCEHSEIPAVLLQIVGTLRVGDRPGRIEPRAVKRRPKPYPLLTIPRDRARADIRLHGHPKKVK